MHSPLKVHNFCYNYSQSLFLHTFLSENIKEYLGDLASLSEPSGLNLITTQHPFPIPNTYKYMQNNIEKIDYKFGLVWWKLLSNKT